MQTGKHQHKMIHFFNSVRGRDCQPCWHGLAQDALTQRTAKSLEKRGILEINPYGQARLINR